MEALPERPTFPVVNKTKGIFQSTHNTDLSLNIVEHDFNKLIQFSEDVDTPYEMDQRVKRLNRYKNCSIEAHVNFYRNLLCTFQI